MIHEEQLPPAETVDTALRLMQKFEIRAHSLSIDSGIARKLILPVAIYELGNVRFLPENHGVVEARDRLKSIFPMPFYCFHKQNGTYKYMGTKGNSQQEIGPQDMMFFGIENSKCCGLASCRTRPGDKVWYLPQTRLSFIIREVADGATTVLGCASVSEDFGSIVAVMTWRAWPYSDLGHFASKPAHVVHLNMAVTLALSNLANACSEIIKEEE
jgi:hypothetical protein